MDRQTLPSVSRENYETFQSERERIRQQKHNSWLQNRKTLPCLRDASETEENKQSPELESHRSLLQTLSKSRPKEMTNCRK